MKNLISFLFLLMSIISFGQSSEEQSVKEVIAKAYVGGIHNGGPIDDIRKGFHPSFSMLRLTENEVKPLGIEEWIANIEKGRSQNTSAAPVKTVEKFINVLVTGNAASVVLELYRNDKKIFTDNLLLYKFNEGWRIVSKNYYRHPN